MARLASLIWIAAVAWFAWTSWPHMSLDLGHDPATLSAHQSAIVRHVLRYAAIALVPAATLLGIVWLMRSRTRGD